MEAVPCARGERPCGVAADVPRADNWSVGHAVSWPLNFCLQEHSPMAQTDIILPSEVARELPKVRAIGLGDLRHALAKGLDDFRAMPTHVIFLGLLYPVIGLL